METSNIWLAGTASTEPQRKKRMSSERNTSGIVMPIWIIAMPAKLLWKSCSTGNSAFGSIGGFIPFWATAASPGISPSATIRLPGRFMKTSIIAGIRMVLMRTNGSLSFARPDSSFSRLPPNIMTDFRFLTRRRASGADGITTLEIWSDAI